MLYSSSRILEFSGVLALGVGDAMVSFVFRVSRFGMQVFGCNMLLPGVHRWEAARQTTVERGIRQDVGGHTCIRRVGRAVRSGLACIRAGRGIFGESTGFSACTFLRRTQISSSGDRQSADCGASTHETDVEIRGRCVGWGFAGGIERAER